MIRSFRDQETARLFHDYRARRFQRVETVARRTLKMLDDALSLEEVAALPGNRLEALRGDRQGQHSIRINEQYRLGFVWQDSDAGSALHVMLLLENSRRSSLAFQWVVKLLLSASTRRVLKVGGS